MASLAVPCLKRATELEGYNPNSEFDVGGGEGEDAWVATHSNPAAGARSWGAGAARCDRSALPAYQLALMACRAQGVQQQRKGCTHSHTRPIAR